MKTLNLTKIYQDYKGLWVALKDGSSNKVVASAKTLRQVLKAAGKHGHSHPTVIRIPDEESINVFPAQDGT